MPNRLVAEKSPYLLQHAENPVDWYPWGEDAFAKARAEQKPIFLSIGYSTCHWCHVMAHESFESEAVAKILNEHFVSIKVDREERLDVDRVYMSYVQAMTGHGGWPLSAWLTPELKPFYGGTYYPPEDRHGRPGFTTLLLAIARGWANDREKLVAEGERVIEALRAHANEKSRGEPTASPAQGEMGGAGAGLAELTSRLFAWTAEAFEKGFQFYYESFDAAHGGFGGAPKFPRASNLHFLFRVAATQGTTSDVGKEAVQMAGTTLRKMAEGGIHDHVGGGFHRYSVDEQWFVPHFEKMLYDQAQIALNCLEARQATGDERYAWLARNIFGYVQRDLTHPGGGFYSAEDADSEVSPEAEPQADGGAAKHAEGAFYVWTREEIERVLPGETGALFCTHFDVRPGGNVPAALDPQEEFRGKAILRQVQPLSTSAQAHGWTLEQANDRLWAALQRLRDVRAARPRPHLDDKVIAAWNGLTISAFARGAQIIEGPAPSGGLLQTATRAAEFLQRELYDAERGVLYRSYREGRSAIAGFAIDYSCLIQGLLDLYEAGFEARWLQWAEQLQRAMDERFWDEAHGGYFDSAAGDANIVLRLKEDYDGAEPTPSSVAAANLFRLAMIFESGAPAPAAHGAMSYRERGLRTLEAFRPRWSATPHGLPQMLCGLELALEAPRHVVFAGDPAAADFQALTAVVHERLGRRRALLAAPEAGARAQSAEWRWLVQRAPWIEGMQSRDGRALAYVCEEFTCQAPVATPEELRALLE